MKNENRNCRQRIKSALKDRLQDLKKILQEEDSIESLSEYGLSFDYVASETFRDQEEGNTMNALSPQIARQRFLPLVLAATAWSGGCAESPDAPQGPGPMVTLAHTGTGKSQIPFQRQDTSRSQIAVGFEQPCPAGLRASASITARIAPDISTLVEPKYKFECFRPDQSEEYGIEPCEPGAFVGVFILLGDRETQQGVGEHMETITLPRQERIEVTSYYRCD